MKPLESIAPTRRLPEPLCTTRMVPLASCDLHIMEAGDGERLIIVPATLSELDNWLDLVKFMGQWFRATFFELPGHGQSSALAGEFSSDRVATVSGQLVEALGATRFSLMGFSFGGILAMKVHGLLQERIDRVVLLAPCLTRRALQLTTVQRTLGMGLNALLKRAAVRVFLHRIMHGRRTSLLLAWLVHVIGNVENVRQLAEKLRGLSPTVMEIVSYELDEILGIEFPVPSEKSSIPCYFAMSARDPLVHYGTTLATLRNHFENVSVTTLDFPFHQPPRPFTFGELNAAFGGAVDGFLGNRGVP